MAREHRGCAELVAAVAVPGSVDEYIAGFPPEAREILSRVREAIRSQVPNPQEKIRYGIAAVMLGSGYVVHFAGWKKHVGLYPVPPLDGELEAHIAPYRVSRNSVNFLYSKPVPYELIERVTAAIVTRRSVVGPDR